MTSSPEVGEVASAAAAGGVAAAGLSCAAGAAAAVGLSCANATPPQRQLPSAIAHASWFLIISFRKSRATRRFYRERPAGSTAAGRAKQLQEHWVQRIICNEDIAAAERAVAAGKVADHAARFAHEKNARCHVPWREASLPERIETPCGNPRQVKRGR